MSPCFVVVGLVVFGSIAGSVEPIAVAVVMAVAVAWVVWLQRPGVLVTDTSVIRRGLVSSVVVPVHEVECFEVTRITIPFDWSSRSVELVVRSTDGSAVICPWVGWNDFVSPFLADGTERPVTSSQQRVLDRLNSALAEAGEPTGASSGGSVPRN